MLKFAWLLQVYAISYRILITSIKVFLEHQSCMVLQRLTYTPNKPSVFLFLNYFWVATKTVSTLDDETYVEEYWFVQLNNTFLRKGKALASERVRKMV